LVWLTGAADIFAAGRPETVLHPKSSSANASLSSGLQLSHVPQGRPFGSVSVGFAMMEPVSSPALQSPRAAWRSSTVFSFTTRRAVHSVGEGITPRGTTVGLRHGPAITTPTHLIVGCARSQMEGCPGRPLRPSNWTNISSPPLTGGSTHIGKPGCRRTRSPFVPGRTRFFSSIRSSSP